jgi:hypothetical protein
MSDTYVIYAILGLQITVLFGILLIISRVGTIIWGEVYYLLLGVVVTGFALLASRNRPE